MDTAIETIYLPKSSSHGRPKLQIHSRSNSIDSIDTINSTTSCGATFSPVLSNRDFDFGCAMDALAKETMGLPIFVSHSTGNTVSSGSSEVSSQDTSATDSTQPGESLISGKRISQVLDFALTSLETLIVKSEDFIVKSAGILLDTSEEEEITQRDEDLESGRRQSICTAMRDKDGWVEGWLD